MSIIRLKEDCTFAIKEFVSLGFSVKFDKHMGINFLNVIPLYILPHETLSTLKEMIYKRG